MLHQQLRSLHVQGCQTLGLPDPRPAFLLPHAPINVLVHSSRSLPAHFRPTAPLSNLIQSGPALEKLLLPYFPGSVPHPARPIFAQSMSIEPFPVH